MGEAMIPGAKPALPLASGFPSGSEAPRLMALWSGVMGLIVRLHDRVVDADVVTSLQGAGIGDLLANLLPDDEGREVAKPLSDVLLETPPHPT